MIEHDLDLKEELPLMEATYKMLDIGLWPEEIAEILKQPIEKVNIWVEYCKTAKRRLKEEGV